MIDSATITDTIRQSVSAAEADHRNTYGGQPMKFSVIIPAHNSAAYIERGLQSIASQHFTDYELIVVCDRCSDNTEEVAKRYGAKTVCVDYGLDGMARNKGLDMAQGEWVLFMDDDDWFLHEYVFDQLAETVGKHGEDMLFFSFIWKGVGYTRHTADKSYIAVWSKCWRRAYIGDTRFPPVPYWSDVEFCREMSKKKGVAAFWDMPMYYYNYLREGSISWMKDQGMIEGSET